MIFYKIKGFDNYEISKCGKVKSLKRKIPSTGTFTTIDKILKTSFSNHGYYIVRIKDNNKKLHNIGIHRLLSLTFIPNPENKPCVNHKNGIRSDNRLENLEWVTYSENSKHGYQSNGRINSRRKLNEKQVIEIKERLKNYKYGLGRKLAKEYNVSTFIISLIHKNKCYKSI